MKDLSSRKQFLIAQSDLSRAELVEDFTSLKVGFQTLTRRTNSFNAITTPVALLVSGLAAFQRGRHHDEKAKPSWVMTLLKGAGLASTVWLALQSPDRRS